MSLTGPVFLGAVVVVTVVAFLTVVAVWPTMAGRSPGRVLGRIGLLLTVNVLVLLTAATQLNAQFLFYADWTDLRGAFGGAPTTTVVTRGGVAAQAARVVVRGPSARAPKVSPALPTGPSSRSGPGVTSYTVRGPASGMVGTVVVELPPGYGAPANASTHYPVIEAFQGYPGSPTTWTDTMSLGGVIAQQVAAGRMRSALIVGPQVEMPAGVDTECVNGTPGNPQLETWLARDVPDWVAKHFRVATDRGSWATIGLSAGAWCAAMITMLHPSQYSAAIAMGGYFRPTFGPFYQPYPPGSTLAERYDLIALARRGRTPAAIWLETSHADTVSYASSSAFLKASRAPLAVNAIVLQHAGHRLSLWKGLLPGTMAWLGGNIPGFSPLP
jgi:S-formylglutathione hydrolase FrmB